MKSVSLRSKVTNPNYRMGMVLMFDEMVELITSSLISIKMLPY